MHILRSLAFYIIFYGGSVFHVVGAVIAIGLAPSKLKPICDAWSAYHHACVQNILGIKVIITGQKPKGAALYAIKHEAFFEAIEMPHLLDYPSGFAKKELFSIPGWGRAAKVYGVIAVSRGDGAKALREMLKQARPIIAQGRPLVIFPEGTRVPHGTRPGLQSGFAALYKLLRLPVVPVAVDSGKTYHHRWKKRGEIHVHFGDVIEPGLPREDIEARVTAAINALNTPAGSG